MLENSILNDMTKEELINHILKEEEERAKKEVYIKVLKEDKKNLYKLNEELSKEKEELINETIDQINTNVLRRIEKIKEVNEYVYTINLIYSDLKEYKHLLISKSY